MYIVLLVTPRRDVYETGLAGQPLQDSSGQPGQDFRDRTDRTRKSEHYSKDRTAWAGERGNGS
jgi:hypothetical protein